MPDDQNPFTKKKSRRNEPTNSGGGRNDRYRKRLSIAFGATTTLGSGGFSANVSREGLEITTTDPTHVEGTELHLSVVLPNNEIARAKGVVMWARNGSKGLRLPSAMGVKLLSCDDGWLRLIAGAGI